jgi:antitoxin component of MazEF toxin-antitoxin module
MGIPKPIASTAPEASNAPVVILPNNVYGKINLTMSNVFSAMVTIQPTTRDALFIKTYRREPSHHFEEDKTANTP